MLCIDCQHFKTRVITKKNFLNGKLTVLDFTNGDLITIEPNYKYLDRIKEYISSYGYARIFYCEYGKLWKEYYINSYADEMYNTEYNCQKKLRVSEVIRGLSGRCKEDERR